MDIEKLIGECERELEGTFREIGKVALANQKKVLAAFREHRIALRHFAPTTGYGYGDEGREALGKVFASALGAESAVVSPNLVSGTHALTVGLFSVLRPGDKLLAVTGDPYDTLGDVISGRGVGSLADFGVRFGSVELKNGEIDYAAVEKSVRSDPPKVLFLQRSRGYEWREALSSEKIGEFVRFARGIGFDGCIFADNCYGEFTETIEPADVGADLMAGSLIKNPGGGIAPTGAYIAGKSEYVRLVENRLTAPSIGGEVGSYAFSYQYFFEGLFLAPHVVAEALKGSRLIGAALSKLGYDVSPAANERAGDIILAIRFGNEADLVSFVQAVQRVSPIDSFVTALPWEMPGYRDPVIMAAGCFVQGASIELSADAPVRPPYIAYVQGGLTYEHCRIALEEILKNLSKSGSKPE